MNKVYLTEKLEVINNTLSAVKIALIENRNELLASYHLGKVRSMICALLSEGEEEDG